jgi:hypothetical protein
MQTVTVKLTLAEAKALLFVAVEGWGDGDFAEYLNDEVESLRTQRAIRRLRDAITTTPTGQSSNRSLKP